MRLRRVWARKGEKCLWNQLDKQHSRGLRGRETLTDPFRSGAGSTVAQNGLKPCGGKPFGLQGELKSGSQNGNSGLVVPIRRTQTSHEPECHLRRCHSDVLDRLSSGRRTDLHPRLMEKLSWIAQSVYRVILAAPICCGRADRGNRVTDVPNAWCDLWRVLSEGFGLIVTRKERR
jgi:hypothetical protein